MTKRSIFAKAGLTGVAGVMALTAALSVPSFAQAQSGYYGQGNYNYDPCRRDTTTRGTTGALIGGALLMGAAAPALAQGDSDTAFKATTFSLSAYGETRVAPDMATITLGVQTDGATAAAALSAPVFNVPRSALSSVDAAASVRPCVSSMTCA